MLGDQIKNGVYRFNRALRKQNYHVFRKQGWTWNAQNFFQGQNFSE